jgi:antitoxin component of MazEF toxin-antitoxin module
MEATIVKIGNSMGLIIPRRILAHFGVGKKVDMQVKKGGLFIVPLIEDKPRDDWEKQFSEALQQNNKPDNDLFESLENNFDNTEWTW